jgi:hypothetical protein
MKLPENHYAKTPFEIGMVVPLSDEVHYSLLKLAPGTQVTVQSFTEVARGFLNNNGMIPGIYENFRWLNVSLPDGRLECIPDHYLDATGLTRVRRERAKVADLPEVPFCEGDTVIGPDGRYSRIINIDYLPIWRELNGETGPEIDPRPYSLQATDNSGQITARAADMKLVNRGLVYAFYNGGVVDFDNAEDEAKFYTELGHTDAVINPVNDICSFSRDEAIEALQAGNADVVLSMNNCFLPLSDDKTFRLSKFWDKAVGDRVREAYLATLSLPAPAFG